MATTTIPWGDGSGDNIYLTYSSASGNQTVTITSDANTGYVDRTKDIVFATTGTSPVSATLTVNQSEVGDLVVITRNDNYITYNNAAPGYKLLYDARIAYLQSSGTQYINTGLKPLAGETIEVTFQYQGSQSTIVFGCRKSSSTGKFVIGSGSSGTIIYAALGTKSNTTLASFNQNEHKVALNSGTGKASIDGGSEVSIGAFATNNLDIYVFACNQNGTLSYQATARVMEVKIGERMHLIPVRKGTIGYMYDEITGTLLPNAGTGDFTLGADL